MAHFIKAVVAREPIIEELAARFEFGRCIPTSQDFAILPVSVAKFEAELRGLDVSSDLAVPPEFEPALIAAAADLSSSGPLAIIQTEYFGGGGEQGAGVLSDGVWVVPWELDSSDDPGPATWPINKALAAIGVLRGQDDEFESIGLGRYRNFDRLP